MTFDPVTLGILWQRLISVTDEIVASLVRTSFSTIVRESYDLSCVLLDPRGNSLAQGSFSAPSFIGTVPVTVRHLLACFPADTLRPGDVLATNDPWLGTGHLYDITVMRPVFRGRRLVGLTATVTHLPDIGGRGFSATAREVFEEGLRLPPFKLCERGRLVPAMVDLIAANVRVPEQVIGDIKANVTANELGATRVLEIMEEYDIDDLVPLADAILLQAETAMRREIARIPDGTYEHMIQAEGVDAPITIACKVVVKDDDLHVDFEGSSPQTSLAINTPFCYTSAFSAYALKCLTVPDVPNNEGAFRPVRVSAPTGSILNPLPPAATGARHAMGHFIPGAIFGALKSVLPERVVAEPGLLSLVHFSGFTPQGERFSTIYFAAGGMGARHNADGLSATPAPSNMCSTPVEVFENLTGITVERRALVPDSGGKGRYRGGLGQEVVFRNTTNHALLVSFFANRTQFPAEGYHGGGPGSLRSVTLNGQPVPPKSQHWLAVGDTVVIREAGGGGYGDPTRRDPPSRSTDATMGYTTTPGPAPPGGARRGSPADLGGPTRGRSAVRAPRFPAPPLPPRA